MFYRNETVRCSNYGVGLVVATAVNPTVRFISGLQRDVDAESLVGVPPEVYDAAVADLEAIEEYTMRRLYGPHEPVYRSPLRPQLDLVAAMRDSVCLSAPQANSGYGASVLCFP